MKDNILTVAADLLLLACLTNALYVSEDMDVAHRASILVARFVVP